MAVETIDAWLPDFTRREFYYGKIRIENGRIAKLESLDSSKAGDNESKRRYILPGLVDSHVHIESSMLTPSEFAKEAIRHGTVSCISDPHEIANVLGEEGIEYMFRDAENIPLKIYYTAPSCVPATAIESSGARLGPDELEKLDDRFNFIALGEMMNFPGVLSSDKDVMKKLQIFRSRGKTVDGHAPGLSGEHLRKYIASGIDTDHEAKDIEEAREKIKGGMKILIREGSAAKNFESLWPLISEFPGKVMLCSDDLHPDDLIKNHINGLVRRALGKGLDIFDIIQAASINPVNHYKLNVGLLRPGDPADFIIIDHPESFKVLETYIDGHCVMKSGRIQFAVEKHEPVNRFNRGRVQTKDFQANGVSGNYRIIGAIDGDLYTRSEVHRLEAVDGVLSPDNEKDIIRIAVINRYRDSPVSLGWIKNTGLKKGAIASSIAHDSHNIIVMGLSCSDMACAVNLIIENQGGISCCTDEMQEVLPLPLAGLMSMEDAASTALKYERLTAMARSMGSVLTAPFMTLSFMALLVIPELKIGDRGLFDVKEFNFVDSFIS